MNEDSYEHDVVTSHFENTTDFGEDDKWETSATLVRYWVETIALPIVLSLGILGNLLNMIILTRKQLQAKMDEMEKSGHIFLIALAVSDFLFCVAEFPLGFMHRTIIYDSECFMLYYRVYHSGIINMFILSSTALTVVMAVSRATVVLFPLRARSCMTLTKVKVTLVLVYVISAILALPRYWTLKIRNYGTKSKGMYMADIGVLNDPDYKQGYLVYKLLWSLIGAVIPFILLIISNVCLIKTLRKSFRMPDCHGNRSVTSSSNRLTHILVAIVIIFLLLVFPAEVLKLISIFREESSTSPNFEIAAIVTNFMQSLNFTLNFILYYSINVPFRKTVLDFFRCITMEQNAQCQRNVNSTYRHYKFKSFVSTPIVSTQSAQSQCIEMSATHTFVLEIKEVKPDTNLKKETEI
ncbi:unnamed protein product [Owenia fusiformis]|uniref:Uncharacterized protein n=1 Tax=Owenia fusiformis TaxID=6347 RepID=A0A8J1TPQ8_OWEFU|nr:unnamed protein product [Owenia fusiformis]